MLDELDAALQMYLTEEQRSRVMEYVEERIAALANSPAKAQKALLKISEKLDDADYWQSYAEKL